MADDWALKALVKSASKPNKKITTASWLLCVHSLPIKCLWPSPPYPKLSPFPQTPGNSLLPRRAEELFNIFQVAGFPLPSNSRLYMTFLFNFLYYFSIQLISPKGWETPYLKIFCTLLLQNIKSILHCMYITLAVGDRVKSQISHRFVIKSLYFQHVNMFWICKHILPN